MLMDRVPHKVVIYYDIQNSAFMIRVIDEYWRDIVKYDTLPVLCKVSDLYVQVLPIDTYHYLQDEEQKLVIDDSYMFEVSSNGNVDIHLAEIGYASKDEKVKEYLKVFFNVPSILLPVMK